MISIDQYVHAATRANTRKAYRAAVQHFEDDWGGFLPATADSVARYLVDHAQTHTLNTLRQRLAGLAAWHLEQGFPDPTKAPYVKKVLKGIAELHQVAEKRARPIQLVQLTAIIAHLDQQIARHDSRALPLQPLRNKALMLIGFWRAFRSDELARLDVEHIQAVPGSGMEIYLPRTKGDRSGQGRYFKAPALKQLCPVEAYLEWVNAAQIKQGTAFRGVNRWGQLADEALHPNSIIGIVRSCCRKAGIEGSDAFSSHSLRRGFASWANDQRWDTKSLMEYVGWRDVQSAMRYIDAPDPFARLRIEHEPNEAGASANRLHPSETE
jgi:integrase|tara:strand:- start:5714 stop:6685 length:972 start_codon:yes stop_codon:yes gene_type:complete